MQNQAQQVPRVITDEKGIAAEFLVSVSFVRKDRAGKRIFPFFRIGDLIRYDVERCREALLASEEGGPQKATRRRVAGMAVAPESAANSAPAEPPPRRGRGRPRKVRPAEPLTAAAAT